MPVQVEIAMRPTVYLLAIIFFWHIVKKRGDRYWRLVAVMCGLFVISTLLTLYENAASDDNVISIGESTYSYSVVKALLENVGLFAIVASLVVLLTRRLDTARREVMEFAQIASSSADAIVGIDDAGEISSWNHGAELVFDYLGDEISGQRIERILSADCAKEYVAAARRCREDGFVRGLNLEMIGKGDRIILAEVTLSLIRDEDGEPVGTSLFVRDITEQEEMANELLQSSKMAAMGMMAEGVVHEFGNLLTVISSRAQLGATAESVEEAREEFEAVASCAGRARSITNNLLAYAKRQRPRKALGKVSAAVESAVTLLERELDRAKVSVRRRYDPVPDTAFDREQMVQVFVNLLINSLNAMRESGGTIEVAISRRQDYVAVTVSDNGPGIPQEVMTRLFEPFGGGQGRCSRTGLGLFVARQIVRFHNGNLSVESRRNEGTAFHIFVPITKSSDAVRECSETRILERGAVRVAVVDRDSMIRDLLAQALRRRSIPAETFQDAESALAGGVMERFEVLFVDLSIRTPKGERFIEKVKDGTGRIIIGMTGEAVGHDEMRRLEEGVFQILRKPFGLDELNGICDFIRPAGTAPAAQSVAAAPEDGS